MSNLKGMKGRKLRLLLVAALLAAAFIPPSAEARPLCFGKPATIVGTSGPDKISDTPKADVIVTRGGADVVDARIDDLSEPRDRICTGDGRDRIDGGAGLIEGGAGRDFIEGAIGRVFGREGNDRLNASSTRSVSGGPGDDVIFGSGRLSGGSGDDDITGESEPLADTLIGGAGNDRFTTFASGSLVNVFDRVSYKAAPGPIRVNLGTGVIKGWGRDKLLGPDASDVIGSRFDDRFVGGNGVRAGLHGFKGNDVFVGSAIDDSFSGGAGNDRLDGRRAADYLDGGPGSDTILGGGSDRDRITFKGTQDLTIDLAKHFARGQGRDVIRGVEWVYSGGGKDRVLGTSGPNVLFGGWGQDVIKGRGGPDEVDGFRGRDEKLFGNGGDDQLWAPAAPGGRDEISLLDGGGGNDKCFGGRQQSCETSG